MNRRTIRYAAFSDLHAVKRRLSSDLFVRSVDRAFIIDIFNTIAADRDVRDKFFRTPRGAPRKDQAKKSDAVRDVEGLRKRLPLDESIAIAAKRAQLTFDQVRHAYKERKRRLAARQ